MFWSRVCTGVSDTASGSDIEIVAADSVDPTPYYPHPRLKMASALFSLYQVGTMALPSDKILRYD